MSLVEKFCIIFVVVYLICVVLYFIFRYKKKKKEAGEIEELRRGLRENKEDKVEG